MASLAMEAFDSRDPDVTTAFYDRLIRRGPIGQVAFGLFRAQKRSSRAKEYRRRAHRGNAYNAKGEALAYLNAALSADGSMRWGWGTDPGTTGYHHVLYVDTPEGQVSFHSESNYGGPDYSGRWDGVKDVSVSRVIEFCDAVELRPAEVLGNWLLMPFGKFVGRPVHTLESEYLDWICDGWFGIESWPAIQEFIERLP